MLKGLQESLLILYVAVGKGTQPALPNSVAPAGAVIPPLQSVAILTSILGLVSGKIITCSAGM